MHALIWSMFILLLSSTPVWAVAGPGASKLYDGTNDEVDWGDVNDVTTNDASWCMWIKPSEDDSSDYWLGKGSSSSGGLGYALVSMITTDLVRCLTGDGTVSQIATGAVDRDATWTHACCVWDGTNDDLYLWENGTNTASDTADDVGTLDNASSLQNGENNGDTDDATGRSAYAHLFLSYQLTAVDIAELMWKPEGIATSIAFVAPALATGTEKDWVGNLTGTVSGTVTPSNDGPPVMFGLGLPL